MKTWNEYKLWHWSFYTMSNGQKHNDEIHIVVARRLQQWLWRKEFSC